MKKGNVRLYLFICIGILQATMLLLPALSLAQPTPPGGPPGGGGPGGGGGGGGAGGGAGGGGGGAVGGGSFVNPIQYDSIEEFLIAVLNAVVLILFPIIVLMLVYCGFAFIAARGNETKIKEARRVFFWTLIGGLIILGAKALALAIAATVSEIQAGP